MTIDLLSAFIIGLLGAGHCLGMCGGISTMLVSALPNQPSSPKIHYALSYNIGRICSYATIGAIVGFSGSIAAQQIGMPLAILRMFAAVFLIFLALYLGQWWMVLSKIEALGKKLWQAISPLTNKCLPVDSTAKAFSLGAIWGWLPCGLVYSMLTWSLASGNAIQGGLTMLAFGIGTLPAMITISVGAVSFKKLIANKVFRKLMAILLLVYGFYSLIIAYQLTF